MIKMDRDFVVIKMRITRIKMLELNCFYTYSKDRFSLALVMGETLQTVPNRHIKQFTLNFGPQHPAAHGILRIFLQLTGENIQRADPQFGLLHRGTEKLMEMRTFIQSLPYMDRFDYVANIFEEHAYCLAIESLLSLHNTYDLCLNYTRTLFDELSRILNHLLTLSATSLDLSSMGPIFWAFEERERIMEFFERVSGARMHTALYKPYDFDWTVFSKMLFLDLSKFLMRCSRSLSGAFLGLLNNRILKSRLASVGMLSSTKILNYSISGVIARSAGLKKDLRLKRSTLYGSYWYLTFRSFMGKRGDNLDRFILRVKEVLESFRIISQTLNVLLLFFENKTKIFDRNKTNILNNGFKHNCYFKTNDISSKKVFSKKITDSSFKLNINDINTNLFKWNTINNILQERSFKLNTKTKFTGMENLINHFRVFSEGALVPAGIAYQCVESPKGELGVIAISNGGTRPYRIKIRTPVSHNMHLIPSICIGVTIADFVATFCSLDIVLGDIDR